MNNEKPKIDTSPKKGKSFLYWFQDQYIFLHSALSEALMLSSSAISAPAFSDMYQELLQINPVKRRRNIEIKFDVRNTSDLKRDIYAGSP